ncbi:hypothetical protein PMI16_04833 [Herbaspirillum sp. CF444]|nr:hypothetical protein PMI16_04833 [Herbaspirillum sp. CF444]
MLINVSYWPIEDTQNEHVHLAIYQIVRENMVRLGKKSPSKRKSGLAR